MDGRMGEKGREIEGEEKRETKRWEGQAKGRASLETDVERERERGSVSAMTDLYSTVSV